MEQLQEKSEFPLVFGIHILEDAFAPASMRIRGQFICAVNGALQKTAELWQVY
jgi:hypothetical protein